MKEYIKMQYKLFIKGEKSIGIEKIHKLAEKYMTEEERNELFADEGGESNG
jgi:hypothetical protein